MLNCVFYLIVNAVRVYIIYRFIGIFFEKENRRKGIFWCYFLFYIFSSTGNLVIQKDIVNLLINFGGLILITLLGYRGSVVRKLMAVILNLGVGVITENIAWILFVKDKASYMENYGLFFFVLILLLIEVFIEKTCKIKKGIEGSILRNIIIICIPVGSIFIANVLIDSSYEKLSWVFISLCFILFINMSLLYLYEKILDDYVNLKDKEMYQLQMIMYENQLSIMQNANDTYKMLRHDMKHHIFLLSDYIKNDEKEKALQYLDKMSHYSETENHYVDTGNKSIDSILNYILAEIGKIGGKVTTDIKIAENLQIDDFDMNIMLSNLLLNAYEAVQKSEKKELEIFMKYNRGILKLRIKNTFCGTIREKQNRLFSTKKNDEEHGIGLESVKRIVEKYNGEMKIDYTKQEFWVDIFLYIPKEKNE